MKVAVVPVVYVIARAYSHAGKWGQSVVWYERAVAFYSKRASWHYRLGYSFQRSGRLGKAKASYRNAIALDDTKPYYHYRLGQCLYQLGSYSAAADSYRRAIALLNKDIFRYDLALALYQKEYYGDAVQAVQTVIKSSTGAKHPKYYALLGDCYRQMERYNDAIHMYNDALNLTTNLKSVRKYNYNIGLCHDMLDNRQHARSFYSRAIKANDGNIKTILALHMKHRRWRYAIDEARRLLRLHPDDAYLVYQLGVSYEEYLEWERAATYYKKAISLDGRNIDWYATYGDVLVRLKRHKQAISVYRDMSNSFPGSKVEYSQKLGEALYQTGQYKQSAEVFAQSPFCLLANMHDDVNPLDELNLNTYTVYKNAYAAILEKNYRRACDLFRSILYIDAVARPKDVLQLDVLKKLARQPDGDKYRVQVNYYLRKERYASALYFAGQFYQQDAHNTQAIELYQKATKATAKYLARARLWDESSVFWSLFFAVDNNTVSETDFIDSSNVCRRSAKFEESERIIEQGLQFYPDSLGLAIEKINLMSDQGADYAAKDEWEKLYDTRGEDLSVWNLVRAAKVAFKAEDFSSYALWTERITKNNTRMDDLDEWLLRKDMSLVRGGFNEFVTFGGGDRSNFYSTAFITATMNNANVLFKRFSVTRWNHLMQPAVETGLAKFNRLLTDQNSDAAKQCLCIILDWAYIPFDSKLREEIYLAIHEARLEVGTKHIDALEQSLEQLPGESYSAYTWLALYDIMASNKLLRVGLKMRDKARIAAMRSMIYNKTDADMMRLAAKSAVEMGQYDKAEQALVYLSRMHATEDSFSLNYQYFIDFLKKRQDGLIYKQRPDINSESNERFRRFIQGKRVAIVGPAPDSVALGAEIDSFDIVVRFNFLGSDHMQDTNEFGCRTDVSYHAGPQIRQYFSKGAPDYMREVKWYITRVCINPQMADDEARGRARYLRSGVPFILHKGLNAVPNAVFDILRFNPASVKVFKSNFYMSKNPYTQAYAGRKDTQHKKTEGKIPMIKLQEMLSAHDQISQLNFMRLLRDSGIIEVDASCGSVLDMGDEAYMENMEELFTFK